MPLKALYQLAPAAVLGALIAALWNRIATAVAMITVVASTLAAVAERRIDGPRFVATQPDLAIEVALGGHLQDVVVETWTAASTAIGYLKERVEE